uniref:Uncharacterized protein n=1 Tax=Lactuca sativa TaxID=4236 RepID=A0A9R1XNT3_LACSA|nr:hypothetical protein LSAT_V11C200060030 [Lactuca sativa]
MHIDDYIVVFENNKNAISEALIFYETPTIRKYWMIIPDTCILIANKYGVIVLLFKQRRIFNVFVTTRKLVYRYNPFPSFRPRRVTTTKSGTTKSIV